MQSTEISRVAVCLPPFGSERPDVWFSQAEAQFSLAGITNEMTTFYHIIFQLDHRYAEEVDDIMTSSPQRESFTTLRTALLKQLSPSQEQRHRQLLTLEDMGDRTPSQFQRHLRRLAPDVPASLLRPLWTSRLLANVQATLVCHPDISLDTAAEYADQIIETVPQPILSLTTETCRRSSSGDRLSSSRDSRSSFRRRNYSPSSPSSRRPYNGSPSRRGTASLLCWYTDVSEPWCTIAPPLLLQTAGKLAWQTSTAAHVCTTTTGRLFITDKYSKQRFRSLCVPPQARSPAPVPS
jgi:hypothetical protein